MRVAGIYAQHSQSPTDLFNKMAELLDPGGRHDTEEMAFPTEHPRIKVLTAKEGNPAVQVARRPDGSFAIVDGEIYSPESFSVTRDSKNAAKMILGSYFTSGQEAIERLDAAAAITIWECRMDEKSIHDA